MNKGVECDRLEIDIRTLVRIWRSYAQAFKDKQLKKDK